MNYDKSRYPFLLSKEDKATYINLAQYFQKSQAALMFKLFEMYKPVIEQGGERLLRIRSSSTFGDDFSMNGKETVMLMFLSTDKEILDAAARKTGKTLKNYMIDLVKCGLYFNGFTKSQAKEEAPDTQSNEEEPNTQAKEKAPDTHDPPPVPPVKRKRGRPKGSTSAKKAKPVSDNQPGAPVNTSSAKPPANAMPSPQVQSVPEARHIPQNAEEQKSTNDDISNEDILDLLNNGGISVL